ncbi:oxidoreductase [Microthyrium microscopicum]|uniref:Oxidoreductase n=1 Tax=Microthyrium microscopicum TaxID=703497 RepID=A0A6A6U2A9_9PEZI|nr:oxidoreductase [Microthyrium microscopicum]
MAAPLPSATTKWHTDTYEALSPRRPELSAKGKTVLITGGGTGIGAETALYFAEAGAARIALLGRREQPLLDTKAKIEKKFAGIEVFVASTDITNQSAVNDAFAKFAGASKIDVFVSNAALLGPPESVNDVEADKLIDAVQANLKGAMYVAQAFLRYASPDAVAINVTTAMAHLNMVPGFQSYNVSKLAVFRLWDSLAFVNPKLRVFHMHPGVVDTALSREAGGVESFGMDDKVALPASFAVWLSSDEARFLKGKFCWANWDVDELKAKAKAIEASPQLSIQLVGWPFEKGS